MARANQAALQRCCATCKHHVIAEETDETVMFGTVKIQRHNTVYMCDISKEKECQRSWELGKYWEDMDS